MQVMAAASWGDCHHYISLVIWPVIGRVGDHEHKSLAQDLSQL